MKGYPPIRASRSPSPPLRANLKRQKCGIGSKATLRSPSILGKGQFSIFLPRRVDSEYYVKSPVKVKAEMFLYPEHLGVGGLHVRMIPCTARAEKLTEDNRFSVVNVPIKIEAEVLLSPGINHTYKTSSPLNGVDNKPQCTMRLIEPNQKSSEAVENWQLWGTKTNEVVSKLEAPYCNKGNKAQVRGVMVEELKLDDNCKRTKDLSRQLTCCLDQVSELNKRIQKLQERLRDEESKGADSLNKVHMVEQQCKVSEQKLKAAECRAKVAEQRAEGIKNRSKILSISCGHQGVQLKDLARHLEVFAKNLQAQTSKVLTLDGNKVIEHQELQSREGTSLCDTTTSGTPEVCHFEFRTIARTKPFHLYNHSNEIEDNVREKTPDLHTPSSDCFYQTVTVQELSNKYVLFLCRRSPSPIEPRQRLPLQQEEKHETTIFETNNNVPLKFPSIHTELLLNQLLQMGPNWHMEFDSSIQRAEELGKRCITQVLKLRDLSRDLDCFPSTTTKGDSTTAMSSTSTSPSKGKVRFVEEDVTPSPQSTPLSESREDQAIHLHTKVAEQTNRCLERYLFNLAEAAEALLPSKKVIRIDAWIQTLPEQPVRLETSQSSVQGVHQCLVINTCFGYRYEAKAWRIACRTVVQGLLLCLGFLLLPQVSFYPDIPPPT